MLYSVGPLALNTDPDVYLYTLYAVEHLVPLTCEKQRRVMDELQSVANILLGPHRVNVQQLVAMKPRHAEDT